MLFFDADQEFGETELHMLDVAARRTAEAVRRVRADALGTGPTGGGPTLGQLGSPRRSSSSTATRAPPALARRFLRERLTEWAVDDDVVDTAQLCLSELVNNVIMHAHASSELTLHLERRRAERDPRATAAAPTVRRAAARPSAGPTGTRTS